MMDAHDAKPTYPTLQAWLVATGTTQETLAKLAGVGRSHLTRIMSGSRRCSIEKALRLNYVTGVPVENLIKWPRGTPQEQLERAFKAMRGKVA